MNVTDRADAKWLIDNAEERGHVILVEFIKETILNIKNTHEGEIELIRNDLEYAEECNEEFQTGLNSLEKKLSDIKHTKKEEKKELRILRREDKSVLKDRLVARDEEINSLRNRIDLKDLEIEKKDDWCIGLRKSLNDKTAMFYSDMVKLMNMLNEERKSKIRTITIGDKKHETSGANTRIIADRWINH